MIPPYFYCPHPKEMIILVQSSSKRTQAVMRQFVRTKGIGNSSTPQAIAVCSTPIYVMSWLTSASNFSLRFSISDEVLWAFSIDQAIVPSFAVLSSASVKPMPVRRCFFAAYNPVSIYQIDSFIFFSHHKFHLCYLCIFKQTLVLLSALSRPELSHPGSPQFLPPASPNSSGSGSPTIE